MERGKRRASAKSPQRRPKATTWDVVGNVAAATKIDPKWERHYRILMDLRQHLGREKEQLKQDAIEERTAPRQELADVATNTYDRDWALGMLSADQNALYEIEEALNRIRTGTYGICELTGRPIPAARLNAIPWTRFTAEAERELEQRGELAQARPKLGERERVPKERQAEGYGEETE